MIPAAAYIRVSSEMQVETGASLPSQLAAIENYAQQNGYYVPEEFIFRDEAFSARSADRPEFQRMISLAKKTNLRLRPLFATKIPALPAAEKTRSSTRPCCANVV